MKYPRVSRNVSRGFSRKMNKFPPWIRKKASIDDKHAARLKSLRERGLNTVCEDANCPNICECFAKNSVTFLILGKICTRSCAFCSVAKDIKPLPPDASEPERVAAPGLPCDRDHVAVCGEQDPVAGRADLGIEAGLRRIGVGQARHARAARHQKTFHEVDQGEVRPVADGVEGNEPRQDVECGTHSGASSAISRRKDGASSVTCPSSSRA